MGTSTIITAQNLTKDFSFPVKDVQAGWFKNLVAPKRTTVHAVRDISFTVEAGERIAFIGPNGAGKSTTIKMLTGILFPTHGQVSVAGLDPTTQRKQLAYHIGTVFGQRSQLFPNLPITDSFEFFGVMYDLPKNVIRERTRMLIDRFDLGGFITQPVRKLSLGQRMRAEVAAALIHNPKIIFLDEPTIGLDVVAKSALRRLLLELNNEEGTTIFLTSHDVGDVQMLCERTIIVNHGTIVRDMPTNELGKAFVHEKYVDVLLDEPVRIYPTLPHGVAYTAQTPEMITVRVDVSECTISEALTTILPYFSVRDINVYDIDLESVIREMYESTSTGA